MPRPKTIRVVTQAEARSAAAIAELKTIEDFLQVAAMTTSSDPEIRPHAVAFDAALSAMSAG
jgi:hypothetical protein